MPKTKLILICQSGGEFVTNDDGCLSYTGGEAHALNINHETLFDDLKLKLSEMCNLEYKSLSVKYFLPGNKQTLISISNNKDLKRMYDFHGDSITADVFVSGAEGCSHEAFYTHASRESGIKLAETVTAAVATRIAPATSGAIGSSSKPIGSIVFDMSATPADTVKKRRRTVSWKIGANGPTIVALADNVGATRKCASRKKNAQNHSIVPIADDVKQLSEQRDMVPLTDISHSSLVGDDSKDVSLEKMVACWKDGIAGEGQEFRSVAEFRDVLQKYAIAHRFVYKFKKNDTNRATGICATEDCSWKIHASWVPSGQVFRIKKMNKSHTCGGESWKAAHPTKNWLVNIIKDRLSDSPHHKPKEIANGISRDFGIQLNYTQVWRGIEDAREQLQGSYKESYNQLPWFCDKLLEANPGSVAKLFIGDDSKFQRLFVSFQASINGFQNGCRPLLFLDSTALKSKYHEILLTATALDADDCFFPVSFAIVDVENDDNWHWFLEQLRSAIATTQSLTFVSDKEKGLMKSVLEVFENAHHGFSMYHLLKNLKRNLMGPFHGDGKAVLPGSLLAAAHAFKFDSFTIFTEEIKRVSSNTYNWLMQIEPEFWTNALFKGECYNHVVVDVAELYTNWLEEVRELPILQKVEALGCKMMEFINTRQKDSNCWNSKLTPSNEQKLLGATIKAYNLRVLFSSDTVFEVRDDSVNVVDVEKWYCSCLSWKATGLPCFHAIAVFNRTCRSVYDYCSKYFTVDCFRVTYSESINPVLATFEPSDEERAAQVLPPTTPRAPTQQKEKRSKPQRELKRIMTCTRCRREGHNKATCKETL